MCQDTYALLVLALSACDARAQAPVLVTLGPDPGQHVEFRPVSSYAEYLVFPGQRRELKVTVASYITSCDSFVRPSETDTSATVTIVAPGESVLGPGTYTWAGHSAHGGTEQQPERPYAEPTVRLGHHGFALPAGGEIRLESMTTTQDGSVRGVLGFEFPGDGEHVATSLKGSFEAKLCRVRL
jgi:hypothetical protein